MSIVALTPCESSNVAAWGYQGGTLAVQFKSGATYHYADVPPEVAEKMREPDVSIGSFISKNVRGVYASTLVDSGATQDE